MHAKSLAVLENLMLRRKMVESAKESITKKASNFEIYGKSQAVFIEMDSSTSTFVGKELKDLKDVVLKGEDKGDYKDTFDPEKHIDAYLHVRVNEQRTLFQIVYFLDCFGVTWIPIAGILFPLYILPKLFNPHHLKELDGAEYEETVGTPRLSFSFRVCHHLFYFSHQFGI
uniref:Boron transporter-like protein 2 n=1 Tax=Cajanus cajan TaxID=3821 RepID=A0A151SGQ2_CAJCA|nr:Boron transporter-like protein 2 [Cajanus cajan]